MDGARNTLKVTGAAGGDDKPREAFHTQPEFDEGGLRGWLAVTGGHAPLFQTCSPADPASTDPLF
jgi:hypothetical protein